MERELGRMMVGRSVGTGLRAQVREIQAVLSQFFVYNSTRDVLFRGLAGLSLN